MYFNEELNRDIEKLKELRRKRQMKQFHALKEETQKKHNLSIASIYRQLDKQTPGIVQSNPKSEKITPPDAQTENTKPQPDADEEKEFLRKLCSVELYKDKNKYYEIADNIQGFFKRLFTYAFGNIRESGVKVTLTTEEFIISDDYINDICLVFANAYENFHGTKLKTDRDDYLRMKVRNLIEQSFRGYGTHWVKYKELEALTRMYRRIEPNEFSQSINFNFVQIICNELKPGITKDEIIDIYKKKIPKLSTNFIPKDRDNGWT